MPLGLMLEYFSCSCDCLWRPLTPLRADHRWFRNQIKELVAVASSCRPHLRGKSFFFKKIIMNGHVCNVLHIYLRKLSTVLCFVEQDALKKSSLGNVKKQITSGTAQSEVSSLLPVMTDEFE